MTPYGPVHAHQAGICVEDLIAQALAPLRNQPDALVGANEPRVSTTMYLECKASVAASFVALLLIANASRLEEPKS